MDLKDVVQSDQNIENSALISSFILGGLVAAASVAARKGAEHSWAAIFKRPPPNKGLEEDVDIKDAVLWAVVIGSATGLVRLAVRRAVRGRL